MGVPFFKTGNDFWKVRSKHGRDQLFETPELMWETAIEYFDWCKKNPLYKLEQGKVIQTTTNKKGQKIQKCDLVGIPTSQPFSMIGFRLYIGASSGYLTNFKHKLRTVLSDQPPAGTTEEQKQRAADFLSIITQIEDICFKQKLDGAMVGAYNASIVARDLGLREGIDNQVTGNIHLSKEPITFE